MAEGPAVIAKLRIALVGATLAAMTVLLWPFQALAIRRDWGLARRLPHLWHRIAAPVAGIEVRVVGRPAVERPLLLVPNHQSWADIVVLGRVMPLSFIAKEEVKAWPAFGTLARLQRTVFVSRESRRQTGAQADAIAERLAKGDAMVLFAEGTTSDGNGVLPFRTALFGAVQAALKHSGRAEMTVQPVSVTYLTSHGIALGRFGRPLAAWPGAVPLVPHLPRFLAEGSVGAEVRFGPPIRVAPGADRKALARTCEAEVRRLVTASLSMADHAARRRVEQTALASGASGADTAVLADETVQKGA